MKTLKETIKQLASEQAGLKNQRKTVKIIGERTLTAKQAAEKHFSNREQLRHLHAAYYFLRHGVKLPDNKYHLVNQERVDKLVQQYYVAPIITAA